MKKTEHKTFSEIGPLRRRWAVVYCVLVVGYALIQGCSKGGDSIEERRDWAIQFNKERAASTRAVVEQRMKQQTLTKLEATPASKIGDPVLTAATLVFHTDGSYNLIETWIEAQVTVTGVEFSQGIGKKSLILQLPEDSLAINREAAKTTVVFGFEHIWQANSEAASNFDGIVSSKELKLRLLRGASPATDWFPVDLFRTNWVER